MAPPASPSAKGQLSKPAGQQITVFFSPHPRSQRVTVKAKGWVPGGPIQAERGMTTCPKSLVEGWWYSTRRLSFQKCGLRFHRTQEFTRDKKESAWGARSSPELRNICVHLTCTHHVFIPRCMWMYVRDVFTIMEPAHQAKLFSSSISETTVRTYDHCKEKKNQQAQKSTKKKIIPSPRGTLTFCIWYSGLFTWQIMSSLFCFSKLRSYQYTGLCMLMMYCYPVLRMNCEGLPVFPWFSVLVSNSMSGCSQTDTLTPII